MWLATFLAPSAYKDKFVLFHAMKPYGGVKVEIHAFLNLALHDDGQVHSRLLYARKITPVTHWIKGTVDPRSDPDALEKLKISWSCSRIEPWLLGFLTRSCVTYRFGCIVLYCGTVPAANAPGCTAAEGLLYKPWSVVVPTCTARCLHQRPL